MVRTSRRRLSLERLEDRCVPALFGTPWPDPGHLTISFAGDGADVGGVPNVLTQTLDAQLPEQVWKADVRNALQTWAAADGAIGIRLVSDNGSPLGQAPAPQGNPGFGDLRIVARPLSPQTVAVSTPFDLLGGWSGTIILNSNDTFGDGTGGTYDLYSVVLHEAGHVLGLPGTTTDPSSVMFGDYEGVRTGLSAGDVAALQALYGGPAASQDDDGSFSGNFSMGFNNTFSSATPLALAAPGGSAAWDSTVQGLLAGPGNYAYYQVQTGAQPPAALTVTAWATFFGSVAPTIAVFDAQHNPVAVQVVAQSGRSETIQVGNLAANARYFLVLTNAAANTSWGGTYFLGVDSHVAPVAPPTLATGTLTPALPQDFKALQINEAGVYHFDLSAGAVSGGSVAAAVRMTIYDANQKPVFTITTRAGAAARGDVVLLPGTYTIRIVAGGPSAAALPALNYTIAGLVRSDPIGPDYIDPTLNPTLPPPPPPPSPVYVTNLSYQDYLLFLALYGGIGTPWPY